MASTGSAHHTLLGLPPALRITICGGGNAAHTCAAYLGSKPGLSVRVLTRRPHLWSNQLVLSTAGSSWEGRGEIQGELDSVSDDPQNVIPDADLVIVASPAHTHPPILKRIAPFLRKGSLLGSIYCQGGFDWAVRHTLGPHLNKLDGFWGLLNIPWICNAPEYGHRARLIGPKKLLKLASSPVDKAADYARLCSVLFDIPCETVPNFLSLTLTPSNQIIHPARYYSMFQEWDGQRVYKLEEVSWGLYSEFDQCAADWLQKLDDELQAIKSALLLRYPKLDLSAVLPIKDRILNQYGEDIKDNTNLVTIFTTNLGYAGCRTPMMAVEGGFVPNTNSRLFWEDVPFGLCILKSIAQMLELATPTVDRMVFWHQKFMGKNFLTPDCKLDLDSILETAAPEAYGIATLDELIASSLPQQDLKN